MMDCVLGSRRCQQNDRRKTYGPGETMPFYGTFSTTELTGSYWTSLGSVAAWCRAGSEFSSNPLLPTANYSTRSAGVSTN